MSTTLKLILLTLFIPPELSFYIAGLRLTSTRVIFIVLTPMVMSRFFQNVGLGGYRFVASDLFVLLTGFWMFVGPTVTYDFADTLVHSGPVALEYITAYMATRVLLTDDEDPLRFVNLLCLLISVISIAGLADTISGQYFIRELCGQISGYYAFAYNEDRYRFGLERASGTLEHPILFGSVAAIGLLLAVATNVRYRAFCISACALGVVISFSSAPQQCALMGLALLTYGRITGGMASKWLLLSTIPVVTIISLFILTPTPFGHLFDLLTIDSATAYYRLYIWNQVGPAILDNPFFAVEDTAYDYQGSVDSVWLVLSLQYGMVCSIMAGLSIIGSCWLPTDQGRSSLSRSNSTLGLALGIVIFLVMYIGFTVHFWGATWILVGLLLGLRARLGEMGQLQPAGAQVEQETPDASPFLRSR